MNFFKKRQQLPHITLPYTQELAKQQKKFLLTFFIFLIFTGFYSYFYAQEKIKEKELVEVLVASKDLNAPIIINENDFKNKYFPKNLIPKSGLIKSNEIIGKTLINSAIEGEILLFHNFRDKLDSSSIASAENFRSKYAITINDAWFASSLPSIRKNDIISILVSNPKSSTKDTKVMLGNILVLDIDGRTITLNTSEQEAGQLLFAKSLNLPMQIIVHPNKKEEIDNNVIKEKLIWEKKEKEEPISTGSIINDKQNLTGAIGQSENKKNTTREKVKFVKFGDFNNDVKLLQKRLQELGYKMSTNGYYGDVTKKGLSWYQSKVGLPPTGELNQKTLEAINK